MTLITTKFQEIHMSYFRKVALERLVQTDSIFQLPLYLVSKSRVVKKRNWKDIY